MNIYTRTRICYSERRRIIKPRALRAHGYTRMDSWSGIVKHQLLGIFGNLSLELENLRKNVIRAHERTRSRIEAINKGGMKR
jgi:hypothetical protein